MEQYTFVIGLRLKVSVRANLFHKLDQIQALAFLVAKPGIEPRKREQLPHQSIQPAYIPVEVS